MTDLKTMQRKASYFITGMVMWEYFSFYGMQSLLVLYLTQKLHFSDSYAYSIFGSFTSLIYVTPIIGGWLADKYCGYRYATAWGCILIILGHIVLGLGTFTQHDLFGGLALIILGIGLFKGNSVCLIGDCYPGDPAGKSAVFAWYYVSGNIGSIVSMFLCPYLAETWGWAAGFLAAAVGMTFGLIMLLISLRYFGWYKDKLLVNRWSKLHRIPQILLTIVLIAIGAMAVIVILEKLLVASLLVIVTLVAIGIFISIYKQSNSAQRRQLVMLTILSLFACGFWIFDQQGFSSIILFISRFVDRSIGSLTIPAASFPGINPIMVLTVGSLVAIFWRYLGKRHINPSAITKLAIGLFLLTAGFYFISKAAQLAMIAKVSILLPALGLAVNGASEIFVDPVLLASITDAAPARSEGRLVAIYYLITGAIANYLAGQVAKFTVDPSNNVSTTATYHNAYTEFYWISAVLFILLAIWAFCARLHKKSNHLNVRAQF